MGVPAAFRNRPSVAPVAIVGTTRASGQRAFAMARMGSSISAVSGGTGAGSPISSPKLTVIASSASTRMRSARTCSIVTPGRMRQLTLTFARCGNALGAWPPSNCVVTQVVRSMPFQLGLAVHNLCAAASLDGSATMARMSAATSGEATSACARK